jgi:hypothetical protein
LVQCLQRTLPPTTGQPVRATCRLHFQLPVASTGAALLVVLAVATRRGCCSKQSSHGCCCCCCCCCHSHLDQVSILDSQWVVTQRAEVTHDAAGRKQKTVPQRPAGVRASAAATGLTPDRTIWPQHSALIDQQGSASTRSYIAFPKY